MGGTATCPLEPQSIRDVEPLHGQSFVISFVISCFFPFQEGKEDRKVGGEKEHNNFSIGRKSTECRELWCQQNCAWVPVRVGLIEDLSRITWEVTLSEG